ncbi:hypothetical protein Lal_00050130 [Lupinus albus]|uniref:Uncharacterized protein n=1 Tax=Lupinus albus TaxID=3870 RepID=A0A6A4PLH9_LUPAL|nr:hypothetical protein Lalb_Chr12g0199491 [Lupinus albus]KAF1867697.1 hypothetical protein Lal_00050130 [Lupinus albus]
MGTKIDFSINLIATSVDQNNNLNVGGVDVWEHYQNKELKDKHHKRMIGRNNIESIKKTMQMHEDIFKHQVKELHRVYSVQKMLMDEHKKENKQHKYQTLINSIGISHPHFSEQQNQTTQFSYAPNFHIERPAEEGIFTGTHDFDENERGPSSYNTSFQTCKISTSGYDEEMEVDLTLSIGSSKVKKSHVSQLACLDSPIGKTREGECSDTTTPMSSSSVTFTQGLKLK